MNTVIDLIDASIAGTAAVTHDDSANYTLTTANSATDEARQMVLNVTGTLTAARNVVVPTSSKLYFVKNGTTGGFAFTVKTSAGTGISVPNGKTMVLRCDGTNVVSAIDALTGAVTLADSTVVTAGTAAQVLLDDSITSAGASLPMAFDGDANTGFFRAGADILGIATGGTERMRITASGFIKAGNTGSYVGSTNGYHELISNSAGNYIAQFTHTGASPFGISFSFLNAAPDNNTAVMAQWVDNVTARCIIWSDGDLVNHDNSYGAISDERLKQDIVDAGSQWNDIKNLRVRKYRMRSDVEAGKDHVQIGLIAQEVLPVSPGLVNQQPDGIYSVQYSVLNLKMLKAFQEMQARVEALEAA